MNKKSVKYLKGINFSQLTLAKKGETKNFGHAAPIEQNIWENLTLFYIYIS